MHDVLPDSAVPPVVARIDETTCIGCTLCIQACPTDAIVGAAKLMHTVVADRCIGCGLCLPPCPVDCIAMLPSRSAADAERARHHFVARNARLAKVSRVREPMATPAEEARRQRRAAIDAALARARRRRADRFARGA